MTDDEIAAIKARHDSFDVLSPSWEEAQEAHADRSALLAEVERLRADAAALREALEDIARGDYSDPMCTLTPEGRARAALAATGKEAG